MMSKKILLVEPYFPVPHKNKKDFFPIGLLKLGAYLRANGVEVKLSRGIPRKEIKGITGFIPDEIWVTSLFTYWANYVREAVRYCKNLFPTAKIVVGGIYASLLPIHEVKEYTGCDEVFQGVFQEAEFHSPAYDLLEQDSQAIDYQIIHASRGCKRKCAFCGAWQIEPEFIYKKSIKEEIKYKKIIFYDNNLLMNPNIENILRELIELRQQRKISWCESQSGFDGRILLEKPHLARMIKEAGFRYPRIAWDGRYSDFPVIEKQIRLLLNAGFNHREIYVFMLYNWNIPFDEMEKKRLKCWEWQIQIVDCRYRPLNQLKDNYNPNKNNQTMEDYYIHKKGGWTHDLIKQFRQNVREQNICVRHRFPFYSKAFEKKRIKKEVMNKVKQLETLAKKKEYIESLEINYWVPDQVRYPAEIDSYKLQYNFTEYPLCERKFFEVCLKGRIGPT